MDELAPINVGEFCFPGILTLTDSDDNISVSDYKDTIVQFPLLEFYERFGRNAKFSGWSRVPDKIGKSRMLRLRNIKPDSEVTLTIMPVENGTSSLYFSLLRISNMIKDYPQALKFTASRAKHCFYLRVTNKIVCKHHILIIVIRDPDGTILKISHNIEAAGHKFETGLKQIAKKTDPPIHIGIDLRSGFTTKWIDRPKNWRTALNTHCIPTNRLAN
jgi:hypothetical protein